MAKSKAAAADFSSFVRARKADAPVPVPERQRSTTGQKLAACRVSKAQWEKLQHYCIAEDTSLQAIVSEALADWFKKHGLPW